MGALDLSVGIEGNSAKSRERDLVAYVKFALDLTNAPLKNYATAWKKKGKFVPLRCFLAILSFRFLVVIEERYNLIITI